MLSLDFHRLNNTRIEAITQLAKDLNLLTDNEKKLFIDSVLDEDQESLTPFFSTLKDNFSFYLNEEMKLHYGDVGGCGKIPPNRFNIEYTL